MPLNKDFQLYYSLGNKEVGLTAMLHRPDRDVPGHFLMLISPRADLAKTQEMHWTRSYGEAVEQEKKVGQVHVVGLSTPNVMRKYVKRGTVQTVILWKPVDLGYLTVQVADLIRKGQMKEHGTIQAGRLKDIQVRDNGEVILGPPMKFTAADIDQYDF